MLKLKETTHDKSGKLFTAETFLDQLRRSNKDWWDGDEQNASCRWVFRGHKDANWELIPSAFRDMEFNELRPLIQSIKRNENFSNPWFLKQSEPTKSAIYRYTAFSVAVQRFYDLSLELGLTDKIVDIKYPSDLTSKEYGNQAHYYYTCSNQIVSLAQHHGIPTPLLDWTRKPEVALHFASIFEAKEDIKVIAVFALKVDELSPLSRDLPDNILRVTTPYIPPRDTKVGLPFNVVLDAPAENSYLAAQHGLFTMSSSLAPFFQSGKYQPLETEIANHPFQNGTETQILKKYVLSKDEIPSLRLLLDREGLTGAHLMPTFDKVGDAVKSRWIFS